MTSLLIRAGAETHQVLPLSTSTAEFKMWEKIQNWRQDSHDQERKVPWTGTFPWKCRRPKEKTNTTEILPTSFPFPGLKFYFFSKYENPVWNTSLYSVSKTFPNPPIPPKLLNSPNSNMSRFTHLTIMLILSSGMSPSCLKTSCHHSTII